jgi:hypothetical protein
MTHMVAVMLLSRVCIKLVRFGGIYTKSRSEILRCLLLAPLLLLLLSHSTNTAPQRHPPPAKASSGPPPQARRIHHPIRRRNCGGVDRTSNTESPAPRHDTRRDSVRQRQERASHCE